MIVTSPHRPAANTTADMAPTRTRYAQNSYRFHQSARRRACVMMRAAHRIMTAASTRPLHGSPWYESLSSPKSTTGSTAVPNSRGQWFVQSLAIPVNTAPGAKQNRPSASARLFPGVMSPLAWLPGPPADAHCRRNCVTSHTSATTRSIAIARRRSSGSRQRPLTSSMSRIASAPYAVNSRCRNPMPRMSPNQTGRLLVSQSSRT